MEEYEEFCKKQYARLQGEAIPVDAMSMDHNRVSVIQFHGVAVLSPLLTVERRQVMQQYKQRAIELDEKKLKSKKKTLLNRVQEILDTVQVKKAPSLKALPSTDSEITDHTPSSKIMNGFAILPNVLNLPMLSVQNESAKLEKSHEEVLLNPNTEMNSLETTSVKKTNNSLPLKPSVSPAANHTNCMSSESSLNLPTSECDVASLTKESPDPYIMSLQNLLKKSREYIEREQSRRHLKNSNCVANESHSDKENDTIKISDSVKQKARLMNRSRSCSPLMPDKPMLNKSNTLLQTASSQAQSLRSTSLSALPKVYIPLRSETSSGVDTESDEELKNSCMLDCESSIIKTLTGSYAKLPSPEPSLSPKMHRRRPRPLSAGNIVINNPVNACDLSPKENCNVLDFTLYKTSEKTSLSDPVPKRDEYVEREDSLGGHSSNKNDTGFFTALTQRQKISPMNVVTSPDNKTTNVETISDSLQTVLSRGAQQTNICSTNGKVLEPCVASCHIDAPALTTQCGIKLNISEEMMKRNSPVELNKSYDVETPSPILLQSQVTNRATDTPNASSIRESFLENHYDIQVNRRLELDLDNIKKEICLQTTSSDQEQRWLNEQKNQSGSLNIAQSDQSYTLEDNLKKKMLAFEEMRKRLEEQHAHQLSLLIAEQEREQERLQREFEEEGKRLRFKEVDPTSSLHVLESCRMVPGRMNRSECLMMERLPCDAGTYHPSTHNSVGSVSATSHHSYGSTNESLLGQLGQTTSGAPKISTQRSLGRAKTRWSQVYSPAMQKKFNKVTALAKGFLTRRLMQTDKLKNLKQTVKDTAEFMKTFQTEVPQSRGIVSSQDVSLQERVLAQLRAALYEIHDIFFAMDPAERMNILVHDRELRREKLIRQMEKMKSPRDRVTLSSATQKSLDRKKLTRAVENGMSSKKLLSKPKAPETRILQPNQGQNAPVHRLLSRHGSICKKNLKKEAKCCDNLRRQHSLG
ncbi:centriolar coiled-coil protein of 110 kDa [Rhinophrynus dorsalis]